MSNRRVEPVRARTREELSVALSNSGTGERAVVMTMGALHQGHGDLITAARHEVGVHGTVVVTIFVNPLQFGPGEDLDQYPRTLSADLDLCRERGADVVFAPTIATMYPAGDPEVTIDPGPLGELLEGGARPEHFRGVLTVVARLAGLTKPQVAAFGEKDYQQLVLIQKMVRDLELPFRILAVPTSRADDGLAFSSRNSYLSPEGRAQALAIPRALATGAAAADAGGDAATVADVTRQALVRSGGVDVQYAVVTDPELGSPPVAGPGRLLVAARVEDVRLLDNRAVEFNTARATTAPSVAPATDISSLEFE